MRAWGLLALLMFAGCGDDDATPADASAPDARSPRDAHAADVPAPAPMCGNGVIEAGESCDDGNDATGDGCAPDCVLEAGCGDGFAEAPEVCDDGNHLDGDGCRSDCSSDESCGNGTLDVPAGERCDDGNTDDGDGCSADCLAVEACGDATTTAPETCDDGNTARWDGCGVDCQVERTLVVDFIAVADPGVGCDLNADGIPDNAFAASLGGLLAVQNAQLEASVESGALLLLLPLYGLDDPVDDPFYVTGIAAARDADLDPSNNFTGSADLLAHPDSLRPDGLPLTPFAARLVDSSIHSGPASMSMLLIVSPMYPDVMHLSDAHLSGRLRAAGGAIQGIDDGQLCGAVSMNGLAANANPLRGIAGFSGVTGCDGQEVTSFADVVVGGASLFGFHSPPTQPDVDVDRDGLERFEVLSEGPAGCQPVVSACIDGDGTRVEGADCDLDPRFVDGVSATFEFTAVGANVIGVSP